MTSKSAQSPQNRIPHLHRADLRRPRTVNIRCSQPLRQDGLDGGFDAAAANHPRLSGAWCQLVAVVNRDAVGAGKVAVLQLLPEGEQGLLPVRAQGRFVGKLSEFRKTAVSHLGQASGLAVAAAV